MRKGNKNTNDVLVKLIFLIGFFIYLSSNSLGYSLLWVIISGGLLLTWTIYRSIQYQIKLKRSGMSDIDKMTGIQFEQYLKTLFSSQGYKVSNTPTTGDYGADLILQKGTKKIAVQAKRYKRTVGIKAVQEVKASELHYKAEESWVVTNNYFTKSAQTLATSNKVKLIDRNKLITLITDLQKNA